MMKVNEAKEIINRKKEEENEKNLIEIRKDEENKDDISNDGKNGKYNDVLFNGILNKNEEEIYKDDIEKKFEFKFNENENIEEHSIFLQQVKIENRVDTILLEDIL